MIVICKYRRGGNIHIFPIGDLPLRGAAGDRQRNRSFPNLVDIARLGMLFRQKIRVWGTLMQKERYEKAAGIGI